MRQDIPARPLTGTPWPRSSVGRLLRCAARAAGVFSLVGAVQAQPVPAPVAADEFRVTLLGTGSPAPVMRRFGPGVLVQAGGKTLLIDSGRGTTQRLMQSGLRLGQMDALILTHLHSDHVVGIPDLWLTGWLEASYAQRKGAFVVYGPKGTQNLMDGLSRAYDWDIKARIAEKRARPPKSSEVTSSSPTEIIGSRQDVVQIVATQDPAAPALLQESVQIRSESESILSFDLDGRNPQRLAEKPILPN